MGVCDHNADRRGLLSFALATIEIYLFSLYIHFSEEFFEKERER